MPDEKYISKDEFVKRAIAAVGKDYGIGHMATVAFENETSYGAGQKELKKAIEHVERTKSSDAIHQIVGKYD